MASPVRQASDIGPWKTIEIREPAIGLKAVLVIDNVSAGPAIGGVRMAQDVSTEECTRLARAMTLKNAAAGLRHGGAKSVLFANPGIASEKKEQLIRAFACCLRNETDYIPGPDMGLNEECMAWVHDEIHRAVGLPRVLGGIPLDEIGATGSGVAHAAAVAAEFCDLNLEGARVAVQGFGAVGMHAARYLLQQGALLVGAADSRGAIHLETGLDIDTIVELKHAGHSVTDYAGAKRYDRDAIIQFDCDVLIPAARPDVIHEYNMSEVRARLIVQGANIPCTVAAENYLHKKGILIVPDFIANAGGVICGAMEYAGANEESVFPVIESRVRANTLHILDASRREGITPRQAGMRLALERVEQAMSLRRWSVF